MAGVGVESAVAPGINALKTFDPPLDALAGRSLVGVRRRGKHLIVDAEDGLSLLVHLMSAGRLQLFDKRAGPKDRTSRLLVRLEGGGELRLREFGTKQRAWVKLLRTRRAGGGRRAGLPGTGGLAGPTAVRGAAGRASSAALAAARPARHHRDRPLLGRRDPVDGPAVAVQARGRPRAAGVGAPARRDDLVPGRRDRPLRGGGDAPDPRQAADAAPGPSPRRASRARGAGRRSRPSTTRTTSCPTARPTRRRGESSRTGAYPGC